MSSAYVKPAAIPSDMGGSIVQVDSRLRGVFQLLEMAQLSPGQSILDVGMGSGQLSMRFAEKGLRVTGTGLEMESYSTDLAKLQALGVRTVSCYADSMPFEDVSFDIVVMSHVLEHCPNQALALSEAKRVLKNGGQLLVFVPPYTSAICSGHVSIGWNVGQLMYVLLLAGFSVKEGSFIEWSGSVCGFVTKCDGLKLPALRGATAATFKSFHALDFCHSKSRALMALTMGSVAKWGGGQRRAHFSSVDTDGGVPA